VYVTASCYVELGVVLIWIRAPSEAGVTLLVIKSGCPSIFMYLQQSYRTEENCQPLKQRPTGEIATA